MFCVFCGKVIADDASFCVYCGKEQPAGRSQRKDGDVHISRPAEHDGVKSPKITAKRDTGLSKSNRKTAAARQKSNTTATVIAIAALCVAVIAVIGMLVIFFLNRDSGAENTVANAGNTQTSTEKRDRQRETEKEEAEEARATDSDGADAAQTKESEEASPEEESEAYDEGEHVPRVYADMEEFGIRAETVEDYGANLYPDEYLFYGSNIDEYYFYYPAYLFNSVNVEDYEYADEYGDNVHKVSFSGSKGSILTYSVSRRTDSLSIGSMTEQIYRGMHSKFNGLEDILKSSDAQKGRLVLAGIADNRTQHRAYIVVKVTDSYVYQMISIKPPYTSEEERLQYAYVTENEYRMCGFSGSTRSPRSYEEFLRDN